MSPTHGLTFEAVDATTVHESGSLGGVGGGAGAWRTGGGFNHALRTAPPSTWGGSSMTMPSIVAVKRYSPKRSVRPRAWFSGRRFEVRLAVTQLEPRIDGDAGVSDDREADARREQPREHQRTATPPGADAAKPPASAVQPVAVVPLVQRLDVAEAGAEGA